ncbi:MAG: YihY/virulence factor BrkB family protein [Verrucomicrobiaceae bacterium]|nr:MAG: YihY/virulence factor BrkB family protein [Verrucomicrobiaceae bacterium]
MSDQSIERAREPGRGRQASAPQAIPAKGWKDIVLRTFKEVGQDRVTLIAAGVTYFLLLALFPTLTAIISVYGLIVDASTVQEHVNRLAAYLPEGGRNIIDEQLTAFVQQDAPTLGIALGVSLALALWSASSGVKAIFEAMNVAYDEDEKRGFFVLNLTALLFTFAGVLGALFMLACVLGTPVILGFAGLGTSTDWLVQIVAYVLLAAVLFVGLAVLYRFGPSRQHARWRWITPGAVLAVVVITAVSALFSWYAASFAHYEKTYGSLGGLIGFLTWMWICLTAVIVGAELNSETEHQTAKDSTVGKDAPLGERNASMADTVGPASDAQGEDTVKDVTDRSPEWQAGFAAGRRQVQRHTRSPPLAVAIPAALAIEALRRRKRDRR